MFGPKIKLSKELYRKLTECAERAGYSSVDEFVIHVLEKEAERIDSENADEEQVKQRLRGLGYIS
ncbi:MAG: hypothetical protein GXP25_07270 [Planctomycetes bacterium]|nr:hypothetical protein [Planctomycetota bacterium]